MHDNGIAALLTEPKAGHTKFDSFYSAWELRKGNRFSIHAIQPGRTNLFFFAAIIFWQLAPVDVRILQQRQPLIGCSCCLTNKFISSFFDFSTEGCRGGRCQQSHPWSKFRPVHQKLTNHIVHVLRRTSAPSNMWSPRTERQLNCLQATYDIFCFNNIRK